MQLRHITVLLLGVAAALLGLAIFNYSWWEVSERGSKGGFGPLGIEECRDGKCESGSYTPLIVTLDAGSEDHEQWSRQQSRGRYVFGAGAATAVLAIACVLATLARRQIAGTLTQFGLAATVVVAIVGLMFLLQPHSMMDKFGFGRGVFLYWAGFLSAGAGFLVSRRAEEEATAARSVSVASAKAVVTATPPASQSHDAPPRNEDKVEQASVPAVPAVPAASEVRVEVTATPASPGQDDDGWRVPCRFCKQLIRTDARTCGHCWRKLD